MADPTLAPHHPTVTMARVAVAVVLIAGVVVVLTLLAGRGDQRTAVATSSTGIAGSEGAQVTGPAPDSAASVVPDPEPAAGDPALRTRPGSVVARADGLVVEEVPLDAPASVQVRGEERVATTAYRVTLTAGPFPVRDAPAIISVEGEPLCIATETSDLSALVCLTFDDAALAPGATLSLAHGLPGQARTEWSGIVEVAR